LEFKYLATDCAIIFGNDILNVFDTFEIVLANEWVLKDRLYGAWIIGGWAD